MILMEKRPQFFGAKFNGSTESLVEIGLFVDIESYTLEKSSRNCAVRLDIKRGEATQTLTLNRSDWLIRDSDGEVSVLTDQDKRRRFEEAETRQGL